MARKSAPPEMATRGAYRGWPPTCERCGWTGVPSQQESPYIACNGNPAKHQRKSVTVAAAVD